MRWNTICRREIKCVKKKIFFFIESNFNCIIIIKKACLFLKLILPFSFHFKKKNKKNKKSINQTNRSQQMIQLKPLIPRLGENSINYKFNNKIPSVSMKAANASTTATTKNVPNFSTKV